MHRSWTAQNKAREWTTDGIRVLVRERELFWGRADRDADADDTDMSSPHMYKRGPGMRSVIVVGDCQWHKR